MGWLWPSIGLIQGNSKAKPKNSNSSLFRFSATWILQAKIGLDTSSQDQDDGWGIGACMHPRAYFLVVACNIINEKSGWLYFHASCCRLRNRCLSRSTCIGGLSLPSSHALRFDQGAFKLASFFDCPVPSLDLVFCNNLIFHFIILYIMLFFWGGEIAIAKWCRTKRSGADSLATVPA